LLYTYIHATCCTFLYGVNKAILKTRICAYRSNVQQEDDDQSVEPTESETYKFFNPERHVNQRQIDILPGYLPDDIYFRHLRSFNPKQNCVVLWRQYHTGNIIMIFSCCILTNKLYGMEIKQVKKNPQKVKHINSSILKGMLTKDKSTLQQT